MYWPVSHSITLQSIGKLRRKERNQRKEDNSAFTGFATWLILDVPVTGILKVGFS
jgi:hypothetical protein